MISFWVGAYVLHCVGDIHGQWWAFPAVMTILVCILIELVCEVMFAVRCLLGG